MAKKVIHHCDRRSAFRVKDTGVYAQETRRSQRRSVQAFHKPARRSTLINKTQPYTNSRGRNISKYRELAKGISLSKSCSTRARTCGVLAPRQTRRVAAVPLTFPSKSWLPTNMAKMERSLSRVPTVNQVSGCRVFLISRLCLGA